MDLGRKPMIKTKALSAIAIVSAAVTSPVLAQDAGMFGPQGRTGAESPPARYYSRSCIQGPGFGGPCPGPLFGWSIGRDRSRVGGLEPSLRPSN
jgi:hypothetical protein